MKLTKIERAAGKVIAIAAKLKADPQWTATVLKVLKLDKAAKRFIRKRLPEAIKV